MDKGYISSTKNIHALKTVISRRNIYLLFLFLSIFGIYMTLISPKIENLLSTFILQAARSEREVTLNYLTPLNNSELYTQEYNINTVATTDLFKRVRNKSEIRTEDPRVIAMEKFLLAYNSPMYPYAKTFIEEADKNGLDWRLVASISGVESAFGNLIPKNTNNAWGWRGVNPNDSGWSQFKTWEEGIATVTGGLAQGYGADLTPFEIEPSYCPPCGENPAHTWANGVTRYLKELNFYVDNLDRF